jgi:hypothetical protein
MVTMRARWVRKSDEERIGKNQDKPINNTPIYTFFEPTWAIRCRLASQKRIAVDHTIRRHGITPLAVDDDEGVKGSDRLTMLLSDGSRPAPSSANGSAVPFCCV